MHVVLGLEAAAVGEPTAMAIGLMIFCLVGIVRQNLSFANLI